METITTNTSDTLPATVAEPDSSPHQKRNNADQNQKITADIAFASSFCTALESDPEIPSLLQPRLQVGQELAEGKRLTQNLRLAYTQRQQCMGREDDALTEVKRLHVQVKTDFADFREVCRSRIATAGGRTALGLDSPVAQDRGKLGTQAHATYTAAKDPTLQGILSTCGYATPILEGLLSDSAELETAQVRSQQAQGAAERATTERNQAHQDLTEWLLNTKRIIRRTLRERPDLLHKLGM